MLKCLIGAALNLFRNFAMFLVCRFMNSVLLCLRVLLVLLSKKFRSLWRSIGWN